MAGVEVENPTVCRLISDYYGSHGVGVGGGFFSENNVRYSRRESRGWGGGDYKGRGKGAGGSYFFPVSKTLSVFLFRNVFDFV